ncbi:hypothetical protein DL98DRAFT_534619 [Cadophora sp. DSE1049]|nr:hypothetical protein DL98DRAFT_534619 [Cadophora sp. DSE1049]
MARDGISTFDRLPPIQQARAYSVHNARQEDRSPARDTEYRGSFRDGRGCGRSAAGKCLDNPEVLGSRHDVTALLTVLAFLPLAIVQAAAYINKNGIRLLDYLSMLAQQEEDAIELLGEDFEDNWGYRNVKNPIATTWLISFEQIRQRDLLALEYLLFMSCLDAKNIP